jgi:hypothetical protein
MARYRAPLTIGLPFERWPRSHQTAWLKATREGDLLKGRGAAAHWRQKTRKSIQKAVGNYLRFERDRGGLQEGRTVAQLLTEGSLRDYIAVLRRRLAPQSIVTQLGHLSLAISVMTPEADRTHPTSEVGHRLSRGPARAIGLRLLYPRFLTRAGPEIVGGVPARDINFGVASRKNARKETSWVGHRV